MTRPTVYLAGPISGLSYEACTQWRQHAIARLAAHNIRGLNPMRGKEFLSHLSEISADGHAALGEFARPRAVLARDFFDLTRSDLVLVNFLGATRVSIGTCMEIAWAYQSRIPIVCARDGDVTHKHMMIDEAIDFVAPSLDAAIDLAISVLS